jgi:hypothetical protein
MQAQDFLPGIASRHHVERNAQVSLGAASMLPRRRPFRTLVMLMPGAIVACQELGEDSSRSEPAVSAGGSGISRGSWLTPDGLPQ